MKACLFAVLLVGVLASTGTVVIAQDSTGGDEIEEKDGTLTKAVDSEVVIDLKSGDRIRGKFVGESDGNYVVVSPVLGTVSLSRDQVEAVTVIDSEAEAIALKKAQAAEEEAKRKAKEAADKVAEAAKPKSPWSGSVTLGLSYSDASDVTINLNLGGRIEKKTKMETFLLTAKYFYARNSSGVTDNDAIVLADQTWYMGTEEKVSRWNLFAKGTYQWDAFQNWEQRFSPYGGLGYALVRQEDLTVSLRFGAGGTWEYDSDRRFDTQFLFEAKGDWTIDDLQSISGSLSFAPEVSDFMNYLLTTTLAYKIKLGKDTPLSLNLSVIDIYDSKPGRDGTPNDLKVVLALGYEF